jgi:hypothetical protein
MRIADSRVFGIFPLQHKGYKDNSPKWNLDLRASIFGIRIVDRLDKAGDVGHWLYDPNSVGDIHGGQLFLAKSKTDREVPMWRFATGVIVERSGPPPVATPGNAGGNAPVATPTTNSRRNPPVASVHTNPTNTNVGVIMQQGAPTFGHDTSSPNNAGGAIIQHGGPSAPGASQPVEGTGSRGVFMGGGGIGTGVLSGEVPTFEGSAMPQANSPQGANAVATPGGPGTGNVPNEPTPGAGGGAAPNKPADVCRPLIGPLAVSPILDENYGPDLRMEKLNPSVMKRNGKSVMSKPPIGYLGITLTGNEENRQVDLFFPTDNRLIAVNYGGDVLCGSLVCDLTPDSEIDPDRLCSLQALTWVIKRPNGGVNTLAWNIGPSGCRDVHGGYVIDDAENGGQPQQNNAPVATPTPGPSGAPVATPGAGPGRTQVMPSMPGQGNTPGQPPGQPVGGQGGARAKIAARVNRRFKGPFDVGTGHCLHFTGESDWDDHLIGPLHIQWQFLLRENDTHCGPLNITKWELGGEFDRKVMVRMGWNPFERKWDWYTTTPWQYVPAPVPFAPISTPISVPMVPITMVPFAPMVPTGSPGGVTTGEATSHPRDHARDLGSLFGTGTTATGGDIRGIDDPAPPGTPIGGGVSTGGGVGTGGSTPTETPPSGGVTTETRDFNGKKYTRVITPGGIPGAWEPVGNEIGNQPDSHRNVALGGLMSSTPAQMFNAPHLGVEAPFAAGTMLAQALNYSPGKPNPLNGNMPNTAEASTSGPVTGSMVAFAGEGGATGAGGYATNTGAQGDPWVFTHMAGAARYVSGTGPGGFVFMPPEVDLQYARNYGLVPPNATVSTMYVMVAPGAWFAAGVPELGNGTMKDGYIWGFESATGDLVWKTHSNSQAAIEAMRFTLTSQNFSWRSGTSFNGVLDHANTANRTYTFPDTSGTVLVGISTDAPGGGAAATLGTIGGSGPATATMSAWEKVIRKDGTTAWIPTWV